LAKTTTRRLKSRLPTKAQSYRDTKRGRPPSLPHNHPASHPSGRCERPARCRRCVGACPAAGHLPVSPEMSSAALRTSEKR